MLQANLLRRLDRARGNLQAAADACTEGDTRRAATRVRQVARPLAQFQARILSNRGRQLLEAAVRDVFSGAARALLDDVHALRRQPGTPCA